MRAFSLLYHDVVNPGEFDSSGFPDIGARSYKLERDEFERHLNAIARTAKSKPISIFDLLGGAKINLPFLLTFDDGGSSATFIADILESFGWRGHFFIAVNYIGTPSFLTKKQILALKKRGHVIGTHSCSHPERMSHCSWKELLEEWGTSAKILSGILGEQVSIASLPRGYYSKKVAAAASFVGIKALFTSEPTTRCNYVEECLVLGRYPIQRWTPPEIAAGLASGQLSPRLKQFLFWNFKKIAKSFGREFYSKTRKFFLERISI